MDLNAEQWSLVEKLDEWVRTEAEFRGRTESDFLLIFLRSCNFDVESSKKTMRLFYQNRLKYPLWWANRDLTNPSTYAALNSNIGADSKRIDEIGKVATLIAEIGMRQLNCQLHGVIEIVDFYQYPLWIVMHFLWPSRCLDMIRTFVWALPVRVNKLVFLNCTPLCLAAIRALLFILPQSYKDLVRCFGSDLSKLGYVVPLELLPEEYGGSAGSMKEHEDAFIDQVLSFNDYFLEDLKFGYPK